MLLESENTSAFLAVRMSKGGCGVAKATGVFLWLDSRGFYNITTDLGSLENLLSGCTIKLLDGLLYFSWERAVEVRKVFCGTATVAYTPAHCSG